MLKRLVMSTLLALGLVFSSVAPASSAVIEPHPPGVAPMCVRAGGIIEFRQSLSLSNPGYAVVYFGRLQCNFAPARSHVEITIVRSGLAVGQDSHDCVYQPQCLPGTGSIEGVYQPCQRGTRCQEYVWSVYVSGWYVMPHGTRRELPQRRVGVPKQNPTFQC